MGIVGVIISLWNIKAMNMASTKAWYNYPPDSPGGGYQEMTDPMGPYLKPDTNISVPTGVPITTWDSGTITSVIDRGRADAGLSVTQKLDNPPNPMAQYASFNYLGSSNVDVGQHVEPGQVIGVAGSPYGINFALALGVTPVWGQQCPQCSSKQPELDPRIILNALNNGQAVAGSGGIYATTGLSLFNPFDPGAWFASQFPGLVPWVTNPLRLLKLVVGLLLVGLALLMLLAPEVEKTVSNVSQKLGPLKAILA